MNEQLQMIYEKQEKKLVWNWLENVSAYSEDLTPYRSHFFLTALLTITTKWQGANNTFL